MKLPTPVRLLLLLSPLAGLCNTAHSEPRSSTTDDATCSLGIARDEGAAEWDVTVYDVAQAAQRQDWNVVVALRAQVMRAGESITVPASFAGVARAIVVTNVDDAPALVYDGDVQTVDFAAARWDDYGYGDTKARLEFSIPDAGYNWTTADCGAVNVILTGGREGWTCDFPCPASSSSKEL